MSSTSGASRFCAFTWKWSDNEIKMAKDMQQTFRGIIEAAGGTYIEPKVSQETNPYGIEAGGMIIHEVGVVRMGGPAYFVNDNITFECRKDSFPGKPFGGV